MCFVEKRTLTHRNIDSPHPTPPIHTAKSQTRRQTAISTKRQRHCTTASATSTTSTQNAKFAQKVKTVNGITGERFSERDKVENRHFVQIESPGQRTNIHGHDDSNTKRKSDSNDDMKQNLVTARSQLDVTNAQQSTANTEMTISCQRYNVIRTFHAHPS
jgi:hypothetical protein